MTTDSSKKNSRLAKHLQILDLEGGEFSELELKSERTGIESMRPPALRLDEVETLRVSTSRGGFRRMSWLGAASAALAAMIALVVFMPEKDDGYRVKGAGQVNIYAEVAGNVSIWNRSSELQNGTRLRVEFKALENITGLVGVVDRNGIDLFPPQSVWENKITVTRGEVAYSSGSVELTGENEGEILIAVSCPAGMLPTEPGFVEFWGKIKSRIRDNSVAVQNISGCSVERIPLR
jgi:hypothetical protein